MKAEKVTRYRCEICDTIYCNEEQARECEKEPLSQDKGVKIGDIVLIIRGEGTGCKAKVRRKFVYDKYWGYCSWRRYWHTVGLDADLLDGAGTRQLTFNDYEVVK